MVALTKESISNAGGKASACRKYQIAPPLVVGRGKSPDTEADEHDQHQETVEGEETEHRRDVPEDNTRLQRLGWERFSQ